MLHRKKILSHQNDVRAVSGTRRKTILSHQNDVRAVSEGRVEAIFQNSLLSGFSSTPLLSRSVWCYACALANCALRFHHIDPQKMSLRADCGLPKKQFPTKQPPLRFLFYPLPLSVRVVLCLGKGSLRAALPSPPPPKNLTARTRWPPNNTKRAHSPFPLRRRWNRHASHARAARRSTQN